MSQHLSDRELMHQALEALEWASDMIPQRKEPVCDCPICKASDALRERLAQADFEQTYDQMMRDVHAKVTGTEQEPVAWTPQVWRQFRPDGTLEFQKIKRTPNGAWEDYTAPPRREWVGLTLDEFDAIHERCETMAEAMVETVRKLKEKNT